MRFVPTKVSQLSADDVIKLALDDKARKIVAIKPDGRYGHPASRIYFDDPPGFLVLRHTMEVWKGKTD